MHIRSACLLALVLTGCASVRTQLTDSVATLDELRAQNKGIVLIDTDASLHCMEMNAQVGHPDADGHYVQGDWINLKSIYYLNGEPSQHIFPAGDYALVHIVCSQGNKTSDFVARPFKQGNLLNGELTVYDRPIVTFSVRPGEIVDVGNLELPSSGGGLFDLRSSFAPYVTPISASKLQAFASHKPALYAHLVHRPMTTPSDPKDRWPCQEQVRRDRSAARSVEGLGCRQPR